MDQVQRKTSPEVWIDQIFSAKAAKGGVVRRAVGWVDREIGRDRFFAEVRSRGFHLLAAGDQFIVICDPRPFRMIF